MAEKMVDIQSSLHSVPETMIQNHGDYSTHALFKIFHNGETFRLPHYNFDVSSYCTLYVNYLRMLMSTNLLFEIYHMYDVDCNTNLVHKLGETNETIGDFIYKSFKSSDFAFYVRIENTKQYDIERSLITNSTFEEECIICHQTTTLKHYYGCELKGKQVHHGMCGECDRSWYRANPNNTCPMCRAHKEV